MNAKPLMHGAAVVAALVAVVAISPRAQACSTCKCADLTINLFSTEKPYDNRLRVALEQYVRSSQEGDGLERRDTDEYRTLLGLAWSPNRSLSFALQVPWVRKQLEEPNLAKTEAEGLGDIDLLARIVLLRSGALSGSHLAGLRFGVRLPTSEEIKSHGEPLDIDAQPDAGSLAPNVGAWYGYYRFPWNLNASVTAYHFGDGRQHFEPGDVVSGSLIGQYGFAQRWAAQLGVDARYAQKNHFSGLADPDSGGTLAMLFTGIAARIGSDLVINAGAQWPLLDELNGAQHEDPSLRLGLSYDF